MSTASTLDRPATTPATPPARHATPSRPTTTDADGGAPTLVGGPLAPVVGADVEVPLLGGRCVRYANLDYAATAPALRAVAERVERLLPLTGSVHRGAGIPSRAASTAYEAARDAVHRSIGGRPDEDVVVLVRNTTDATNLLARSVPAGAGDVVTLDVEHHATLLAWRGPAGHRVVPHAPTLAGTIERLEQALRARRTALVAITGASNVTGEVLPIARIAALAHAHGARVLVDAAQLLPHRSIDLAATGVDYVAFSGHKLYAPYGAGVLAGRRDWLEAAAPYLAGGGAVRDVTLDGTLWASGPARHEAGTPNLLGAVAIAEALHELEDLDAPDGGAATRDAHERALRRRLLDGLAGVPGVDPLAIWPDAPDAIGVVAFTVEGHEPGLVGAYLSAEHGIGVRDGRFCAHPLLRRLGTPSGALRASLGLGSRAEDADRLVAALRQLVTEGSRHVYARTASGWAPADDDRDEAAWLARAGLTIGAAGGAAAPCGD
ncbi:aminotransferase class V-fold PLP-dependent enzyme [Patulibacter brassicae]|uniref:Aminotransferase class V-fold PLP-dependent enzyme n=1 Tax=Patulibacter brassicae TaxID=1705717 RepID=A0ABU4VJZ5_9ACTN|nr:aminotransferase class V-fold PLP-dependent enzyme [Patulibacter brassicae]MDX8152151.1 aminotransferase class V-fold PLP-dependent enzyme [Patulibacter brassicae]